MKPEWLKELEIKYGRDRLIKRAQDFADITCKDNEGNLVTTDRYIWAAYATSEGRKRGWISRGKIPYTVTEATIRSRMHNVKKGLKKLTVRECVGLDKIEPKKPQIIPKKKAMYASDKRNEAMFQFSRRTLV